MTYTTAVCTVKNSWWWTEELPETCRVLFQKWIRQISASSWFYYKNLSRCTITWTSNLTNTGMEFKCCVSVDLNLNPLTWKIRWAPNNASRWQMGFNSAFKGLNRYHSRLMLPKFAHLSVATVTNWSRIWQQRNACFSRHSNIQLRCGRGYGVAESEEEPVVGSNAYCKM